MKKIFDPTRTIHIPLSGYVDITGMEAIVDHPHSARLRFRRELGFTCMIKPGGLHPRFEHSVGTLDKTRSYMHRFHIRRGSKLYRAMEVYGFGHDHGHGPTCHELEYVLHDDHEEIGLRRIEEMRDVIAPYADVDLVLALMRGEHPWSILVKHKVFGADKLDYLERDAYHTGSEIAMNIGKIIGCMQFKDGQFGIDEDAKEEIITNLANYQRMYLEVYLHRTVKMFARMYQRALMESIEDGTLDPVAVWDMVDHELHARLMHHPLMQRITDRRMLDTAACIKIQGYRDEEHYRAKRKHALFTLPLEELTDWSNAIHDATFVLNLERSIEQVAGCPPHSVFLVQTDPLKSLTKLPDIQIYSRRTHKFRSLYDTSALSRHEVLRRVHRAYFLCVMVTPDALSRVRSLDIKAFLKEKIDPQLKLL